MSEYANETEATGDQTPVRTLLFYKKPVALNREKHRSLRLQSESNGYSFADDTNSIPVAVTEFSQACRHYPIVFAGDEAEKSTPAILVGLRANENLFVDAEGNWSSDYIPAFVRRYPFVLAEQGEADDFTVCVDETYAGFSEKEGEPLFEDDGTEGAFLKRAISFLTSYQNEMKRTQSFAARLNELGLLESKVVRSQPTDGEEPVSLRGFFVVNEQKLQSLTDASLRQLLSSGELAWIYAHLFSLANVEALSRRLKANKDNESK